MDRLGGSLNSALTAWDSRPLTRGTFSPRTRPRTCSSLYTMQYIYPSRRCLASVPSGGIAIEYRTGTARHVTLSQLAAGTVLFLALMPLFMYMHLFILHDTYCSHLVIGQTLWVRDGEQIGTSLMDAIWTHFQHLLGLYNM